jgi:peptide/nickel transport system substrate-binding protein
VKIPLRKLMRLAAMVLAFTVTWAIAASARQTKPSTVDAGGTLNVGFEQSFGFSDNLDPTGEYSGDGFGIFDNLLVRTLVGYKHEAGGPGSQVVPDIATSLPEPTNGGKTYSFHIKPGVMFGPPVSRQVTCADFVNAMQRIANPRDGGQYAFYFTVIKGWSNYAAGKAKSISGISCPSSSTITFNLTAPTGDFYYRMALPATGPQPTEVTKCFEGRPGRYGEDLISTAGYMIKGIDHVDISSCSSIKPASGYDGQTILDLVRNPNYEQSTDPTRRNYVDEFRFLVDSSDVDIYNKVEGGRLDMASSSIPPEVLQKYATTPSLRTYFHQNSGDTTAYITMNTTQPPFDDIHVRRAMNWIIDKAALQQADGGPVAGAIANHIVPDSLFGNQLVNYVPYKTPANHGSLAKAEAAMKGSPYSTKNDGKCDASLCKHVLLVSDARAIDPRMVAAVQQDAAKIGITFTVRTVNGAYPTIQTVAKNIPVSDRPVFGSDYADAETFFGPVFDGRTIIPTGNLNYSLVGITPSQCKTLNVTGDCNPYDPKTGLGVPNVNPELDECAARTDTARTRCYESLDRYLMTNVVPWVPWLWPNVTRITSENVTHYQYDQFSRTPAYAMISVRS